MARGKMKKVYEDAPTNSAGGGGVAGIGVGPQGEPGVSPQAQKKRYGKTKTTPTSVILGYFRRKAPNQLAEDTFAGATVFEVSSATYHNAKVAKRKGKHWRTYLDECDALSEIREYAKKNPHKAIVLRNENTGEMCYARYGRKGY